MLQNNLAPETHKQVPETRNQNNIKYHLIKN